MDRIYTECEEHEHEHLPLNERNVDDETDSRSAYSTIDEMRQPSANRGDAIPKKLSHWKILFFGQLIALIAASANACSFALVYNLNVSLPMTEMCIMYLCLCLCYVKPVRDTSRLEEIPQDQSPFQKYSRLPLTSIQLHVPWWVYIGISLIDVEANFMTLLSFRYTSLMSTSLLGSLTIPSVMIVSSLLLNRAFRAPHYIGVCLCILGGTMTVWLDLDPNLSTEMGHSHSYVGDALAIGAALLYGLGDSVAEYSIKHIDRVEYLFMIGLCGSFLTGIQVPFTEEGQELYQFVMETPTVTQLQALFGIAFYIPALVSFYAFATLFLMHGDATLLVLSLQATQFWAILFSVVAEQSTPTASFFVAVTLMVAGVFVYEICGGQASSSTSNLDVGGALVKEDEKRPLDDESGRITVQ